MSLPNSWAKHYQSVWSERAGDPRLPEWLRVAALAYGSHRRNGHAVFFPGDVALVLGRVDAVTGEVRPSQNVTRAIRAAVRNGWLAPGSRARCLIVPAHAVGGGGSGGEHTPCPVHGST